MDNKLIIFLIALGISILIIFYGFFICRYKISDILLNSYTITGWNITHFIFPMILTIFFPDEWWFILILVTIWEIGEYFMNKVPKKKLKKIKFYCVKKGQKWWYSSKYDLVMNVLGILFGWFIAQYIKCTNN